MEPQKFTQPSESPLGRRAFLGQTARMAIAGLAVRAQAAVRPNILVIVTDDQGYGDVSAYSHSAADISTPNMDRIGKKGVMFTRGYVTAPVCSPSRAGWNTGRYQQRWDPEAGWTPGLPKDVRTIAEYLKSAGYATGKVGKNDFGRGYHRQDGREFPLNHGFDEFLGFSSHAHDSFLLSEKIDRMTPDPHGHSAALGPLFENRGRRSFEGGYLTDIFTDRAIQFLERHRSGPFFLNVAYNAIHTLVHEVPERYLRKFGVKPIPKYDPTTMGKYAGYYDKYAQLGVIPDEDMRKYYLASLACLDDNIGRLLNALGRLHLAGNTLIVFFSDNGGTQHGGGNNRPLRGTKSTTFEGGIRVPFMMRWDKQLPTGKTFQDPVSTLDVLPTCLEAAGIPVESFQLDGRSLLPALRAGARSSAGLRTLFWLFRDRWAVLEGEWKLVRTPNPAGPPAHQVLYDGDPADRKPALFNLNRDPAEQHDVSEENPEIARRLTRLFENWRREMRAEAASRHPLGL
ncbi:MAG TPA: sulfatase-like hydrolase/transferase [Bryobacteraceae bacterium]|nr:sulfatase-like hydrolase/transferase [Bryobacteraceae bacterium]